MTTDLTTEYSLADLTQILSALDGQKRNPCTKKAAIKAINKKAEALGLAPDDVFDAAAALLGGQDPEEWRASLLRDEASAEAEVQAEAEAQIETSWDHRRSPAALGEEALRAEDEARAKRRAGRAGSRGARRAGPGRRAGRRRHAEDRGDRAGGDEASA